MRSEGYSTWSVCLCVCVCVCPPLYSRTSRNYAENKRYERLQRHMGNKNVRKLECYLLTVRNIRSAILSHVHSCLYACVCIVYVCHAGTRGALSGVGTVAGFSVSSLNEGFGILPY